MAIYAPITSARFWSKVAVAELSDCWDWTAASTGNGYGNFRIPGTRITAPAHRIAWELFNNEPLGPRVACHHCDNPKCCNPHHIYAGDHASNSSDKASRGRFNPPAQDGEKNHNSKLSETDVAVIRGRIDRGETNIEIAKDYPVHHSTISLIRQGKSW